MCMRLQVTIELGLIVVEMMRWSQGATGGRGCTFWSEGTGVQLTSKLQVNEHILSLMPQYVFPPQVSVCKTCLVQYYQGLQDTPVKTTHRC